jgi:ADP-ribose pyrophosphatase
VVDQEHELAWTVEAAEEMHNNPIFRVEKRRVRPCRPPSGSGPSPADFFIICTRSWVNVIALTDADELLMIEQWRQGVGHATLEVPGGVIDDGESPAEAARRELLEETGYEAREWYYLGNTEPNPAIQDNVSHSYLALGARRVRDPSFDETEECKLVVTRYADVDRLVSEGKVSHALVVVALYYERLRRAGVLQAKRV